MCPGSSSRLRVTVGYYSVPLLLEASPREHVAGKGVRSGQVLCEAGHYCTQGERFPCPAGRYVKWGHKQRSGFTYPKERGGINTDHHQTDGTVEVTGRCAVVMKIDRVPRICDAVSAIPLA